MLRSTGITMITLLIPFLNFAATFTSTMHGDWNDPATWGETVLTPGVGDDVIIRGHKVFLNTGTVNINSLEIGNLGASDTTRLSVHGNAVFNIALDVNITSENVGQDVQFLSYGTAIITVSGNFNMERELLNAVDNLFQLKMYEDAQLSVNDFTFNYKDAGAGENDFEVQLFDRAALTVNGQMSLTQEDGEDFTFITYDQATVAITNSLSMEMSGGDYMNYSVGGTSSLNVGSNFSMTNSASVTGLALNPNAGGDVIVGGNLSLNSTVATEIVEINVSGSGSTLDIEGNLAINALSQESASVNLSDGTLFLAGNLTRSTSFGAMSMGNTGEIRFDGSSAQNLPQTKLAGSGNDSLFISNLIINNSSPSGLTLAGDLTVSNHLTLTQGIATSSSTSLMIIDNSATVSSGNASSYVDGPMVKRGLTGGSSFIFPVGDNRRFAPIEISPITNSRREYTAEFIGCPPPAGNLVNAPLQHVNDYGYWTLSRDDGAAVGDIDLHWGDADAAGITDMTPLVVAYYNGFSWFSLGKGGDTGGVGAGVSGSVSNDLGCPPPAGISIFTIGSTDEDFSLLPVDLIGFRAYKKPNSSSISLEWETASESNSDFFRVEKSNDGIHFFEIDRVPAAGNSTSILYYNSEDVTPDKGNNYYRIMQVDLDEMMSFSQLVNIFVQDQEDIPTIYPNPVRDYINLHSSSLDGQNLDIKIFDITGQCIYSNPHEANGDQLFLNISTLNLKASGIYFLNYEAKGQYYSLKFMKE